MTAHHTALLLPLLAHAGLVLALYAWLSAARLAAVKRGELTLDAFALSRDEPPALARINRNLANQFELPVLFHVALLAILVTGAASAFDHVVAWIFVAGRLAHCWAQTTTDNVALRGRLFMTNIVSVVGLLGHVALIAIRGG